MARRRSWTDDDLIVALDGARSMAEVVRRLRLAHGGAAFTTVRTRIEQLGLDPPASDRPLRGNSGEPRTSRRRWTDEELRLAVAEATSLRQVFLGLDLAVGGSQWSAVRARIKSLHLDTSHWRHPLEPQRGSTYASAMAVLVQVDLQDLVYRYTSRAEVLRAVGLVPSVTTYRALRDVIERIGMPSDAPALQRPKGRPRRPIEEILVLDSDWTNTAALRQRLIEEGIREARCERCGIQRWQGRPAPLQLDHIDGDRRNNQLTNLRILCANCHALTETWCARNRGHDGRRSGVTR